MIEEGLSLLIDYGIYLLPGFSLCALWFWLTPENTARIADCDPAADLRPDARCDAPPCAYGP